MKIYSIYDELMCSYGTPFFTQNDAVAKRMFTDVVNSPDTNVNRNPGDYRLHLIGEWEPETGAVAPAKNLDVIVHGVECVKTE